MHQKAVNHHPAKRAVQVMARKKAVMHPAPNKAIQTTNLQKAVNHHQAKKVTVVHVADDKIKLE